MKILETKLQFKDLTKRKSTDYIVLHHRAGDGDIESIHRQHLANGWSGIGYHFYIRKDGSIYAGRPIDTVGAHATGFNTVSIGVCFEGNFENENMTETAVKSGQNLIAYLCELYPNAKIKRHNELNATLCPGERFEVEKLCTTKKVITDSVKLIEELSKSIIIYDKPKAVRELNKAKEDNSSLYWIIYKLVNEEGIY